MIQTSSARPNFVERQLLVRMRNESFLEETSFTETYGATVAEDLTPPNEMHQIAEGGKLVLLELRPGQNTKAMQRLISLDPRVDYVELNHSFSLDEGEQNLPNDLQGELWGLHNTGQNGGTADADIDAPEAWAIHSGRADAPIVAVIDTGVDYNHPDLKDNIWVNQGEIPGNGKDDDGNGVVDDVYGFNAFDKTGNPMDRHSHGTHCAGTIAGVGNNGQGMVGVNQRARVMPIKIFDNSGSTNAAAIIRGINYATKMGARVTSNSWGGGESNKAILDAFRSSPALHIMAAGNKGENTDTKPHYPSSYEMANNVSVAASDRNDEKPGFSSYGPKSVDIAAPGKEIFSTLPDGKYGYKSGTSMATPHVSGVAALVTSLYPNISNEELKARLLDGADHLANWQGLIAEGRRLNAHGALTYQAH
ncbi:MAG: S8 family serine peptidase [Candidatus Eremiobacteraeota bacterium]|nr:S8 family serine peptidase [Candidatus Eremiobacteraeota bacterium]